MTRKPRASGYVRCDGWPIVTHDDDGIRPAGRPDACFYCDSAVGDEHGRGCVCVSQLTRWRVLVNGREAGTYDEYLPAGQDARLWHFRMNDSSWCADNALDRIAWHGPVPAEVRAIDHDNECACRLLSFELDAVIDEGPFVVGTGGDQ